MCRRPVVVVLRDVAKPAVRSLHPALTEAQVAVDFTAVLVAQPLPLSVRTAARHP